jgi:hypothetical protein
MTVTDMLRVVVRDIEYVSALIEAGPCGYVLHSADYTHFLCHDATDIVRLCEPGEGDLYVLRSRRSALSVRRYWNHGLPEWESVSVSLRREALSRYLHDRNMLLDGLFDHGTRQ